MEQSPNVKNIHTDTKIKFYRWLLSLYRCTAANIWSWRREISAIYKRQIWSSCVLSEVKRDCVRYQMIELERNLTTQMDWKIRLKTVCERWKSFPNREGKEIQDDFYIDYVERRLVRKLPKQRDRLMWQKWDFYGARRESTNAQNT